MSSIPPTTRPRRGPAGYIPAVGPKLRFLLLLVFACFAWLGATGVYLAAVSFLNFVKSPETYTSQLTLWMFLTHGLVGVIAIIPFLWFGGYHWLTANHRPNRVAVRLGKWVFLGGIGICLSGMALFQLEGMPQLPTGTATRMAVYWLHILLPLAVIWLYLAHRRAGPPIRWKWGYVWGGLTTGFTALMLGLHWQEPQRWFAIGPAEGEQYFFPSSARTADGKFIPANVLMLDDYCKKCHQEIYNDWFHSAHHFSSFNNPPYLFSVRETRRVALERDGNVKASRWCAGCHDLVPFFSGAFDDPQFDDVQHPTAHAGITCVSCHAITHVHDTTGNAAFTMGNPPLYPFTLSEQPILQYLNQQLIKANPAFHKKTFLKPFHKTAEFCSTCHKVSLPPALTHYREFQRGQNHFDTFHLSGVSGHGARSFYYPPQAKPKCADCHMPLRPGDDIAAKDFDGSGIRKNHHHLFPGGNTGLPELLKHEDRYRGHREGFDRAIAEQEAFLQDGKVRIDLFAVKEGGEIDGKMLGPLRPELPRLKSGSTYLVEVVVRTVNIGHPLTQGTADSNELWVEFTAKSGGSTFARNGALAQAGDEGPLDPWAHRINVLMLDRHGKRIDRRNPQDIFTPLYDHQIPPGAAAVVHYRLSVPSWVTAPIELSARVRYRKFDYAYMEYVHQEKKIPVPKLPVVDLCADRVTLPVEGSGQSIPAQQSPIQPAWQRWNDYGIGCLLEGGAGNKRGETRQAATAFRMLLSLGDKQAVSHGHLNLARVLIEEGKLDEAAKELEAARRADPPAPWWLVAWFSGVVQAETAAKPADLEQAIRFFEQMIDPANQPRERLFDFSTDYVVLERLAQTLFRRAQMESAASQASRQFLLRAIAAYQKVIALESELADAHYGLSQSYSWLAGSAPDFNQQGQVKQAVDMETLVGKLTESNDPAEIRSVVALQLLRELPDWMSRPVEVFNPRLPRLQRYARAVTAAWEREKLTPMEAPLATVLGQLHLRIHELLKPDELARSQAIRTYRAQHPADSMAADPIVIYPTDHQPFGQKAVRSAPARK